MATLRNRKGRTRWSQAAAVLTVPALLLAACGGEGGEGDGLFESSYDDIVEAAASEPPVQWCTGMDPFEYEPLVDGFHEMFPDIPRPEAFECSGEEATQRTITEWESGNTVVDVIDLDTEILKQIDDNDETHVQDWTVFDGTPVEVDPGNYQYNGRITLVGSAHYIIAYNSEQESPETVPQSYEECTDPQYQGRIVTDIRPRMFEMMQDGGGPWSDDDLREWAAGMAANEPFWVRGTAQSVQVLSSAERTIHCPLQLHGLFTGNPDRDPGGPNSVIEFVMPRQTEVRDYLRLGIAPEPNAPNAAILFVAWMTSDHGQIVLGEVNPGYSSPTIPGTYAYELYQQTGAEILRSTQEQIAEISERQNQIVLEEWGFPSSNL